MSTPVSGFAGEMMIRRSLSNRLMFATGSAVIVVLAGFRCVTGWGTADRVRSEVTALANEKAAGVAAAVLRDRSHEMKREVLSFLSNVQQAVVR